MRPNQEQHETARNGAANTTLLHRPSHQMPRLPRKATTGTRTALTVTYPLQFPWRALFHSPEVRAETSLESLKVI